MRLIPIFDPVSAEAAATARVTTIGFIVCGVILAVIIVWVGLAVWRFRARPGARDPQRAGFGNRRVEMAWTAAPLLIVTGLFALTAHGMHEADPPARRAPDLTVIGHQWWWEVRYAGTNVVSANEIHLPAGRQLLVQLDSADVIHDFWVPQLGRKLDMIPGRPVELWIAADRPGRYAGSCGEFCGNQHAWMRFTVFADPEPQYKNWLRAQQAAPAAPADGPASAGRQLFAQLTCGNCHAIAGRGGSPRWAPDLTHFASRESLGAGVLRNSPATLALWLRDPQGVKPGCRMPDFKLALQQVNQLVSYLETLR